MSTRFFNAGPGGGWRTSARRLRAAFHAVLWLVVPALAGASPAPALNASTNAPARWLSLAEVQRTWGEVPLEAVEQAAQRGDLTAQHYLGYCYASGERVNKDARLAVAWYQRAGDGGYLPSYNQLGLLYAKGDLLARDPAKAFDCFRRAAEGNLASAQLNLAYAYRGGTGVPRDSARALEWFRKAAANGEPTAMCELFLASEGGSYGRRRPDEAYEWLHRAVAAGNAYAQCLLGYDRAYPDDRSRRPDFREGVRLFRLSAAQHWAGGLYHLGRCILVGEGVEQDEERGLELIREAADSGHAHAMVFLSDLYKRGIGEPRSPKDRPLQLLIRADATGSLSGRDQREVRESITSRYQRGVGTDRDPIAAAAWTCLGSLISPSPGFPIANTAGPDGRQPTDSFEAALSLFLRAARGQEPPAFMEIADQYAAGREVPPSQILAWCWLKLADQQQASGASARLSKLETEMPAEELASAQTQLVELKRELQEIAAGSKVRP